MLEFLRHNFRWIAGGFLLTFFSSFGQTFYISASVAEWQEAFGLSHGEFGRLYMFATLGSAVCLPFAGRLVDRLPEHRMIAVVIPVLALASVMAAYAPSVSILLVAIFLLRLFGQGMLTHIALTATGRWFDAQRGRAVSLVVLGHQGGEATLPLAFAAITFVYGYQSAWIAGALLLILVGLPFAYLAYRQPRTPQHHTVHDQVSEPRGRSWTRSEVLRDPIFFALLTGVLAPAFIGTTIFYHQDYLTTLRDWPAHYYSLALTLMAFTTVVFALIAGALIDRFRSTVILPFFLVPLGAACFALAFDGPAESIFVVMVLLGISYGFSSTLAGAVWPEIYGTANLGAIRAIVVSAAVFATAIGPGLTGTLIDLGVELPVQLKWLGLYCMAASLMMALAAAALKRRRNAA